MARASLADVIGYLRQWGNAATTDSFNGVTYWDDEQLEAILDSWATRRRVRLQVASYDWTIFKIDRPRHHFADSATITIYTGSDTEVTTNYTFVQERGEVVFDTALAEGYYYVEALFISMWSALADLWEQKANQRSHYVDFKAGQNKMNLEQEYRHCVSRGQYYRNKVARRHKRKWRP